MDSDDLVSSKIASYVHHYPDKHCAVWRITHGYVYEENSMVAVKNKKIWCMNGSTHIVRADLVTIPDFDRNFNLFAYSLFESHTYAYQRLIDFHKEKLEALPFYEVIYLIHKNNYSMVREIISSDSVKLLGKKILLGRIVTKKMRKEFGLYPLNTLPGTRKAGKEEPAC